LKRLSTRGRFSPLPARIVIVVKECFLLFRNPLALMYFFWHPPQV
jgi:hypothetical protein